MSDTEHRDSIICPHCGEESRQQRIWVGALYRTTKDTTVELTCEKCGGRYKRTRHITVTYTTKSITGATEVSE